MSKPPKIVIPGLNRGAGVPPGFVLGRQTGTGKGPAELLNLAQLRKIGLATAFTLTTSTSQVQSIAHSETVSLSRSVSSSLSAISSSLSGAVSSTTSLSSAVSSVISGSISSVNSTDVRQSTSLSQISSSLSGAISSTTSLSSAVSTVVNGSVSTLNSRIDSLSTAGGGGGATTFLGLTDTPATYAGQTGKVPAVNGAETALEFVALPGGTGQSTSLSQISSSLSGAISSTTSLSTAVSTVDLNQSTSLSQISNSLSAEISTDLSRINSLSTAVGGGGGSLGVFHAYEEQPSGTAGTSSTVNVWVARILNSTKLNTITSAARVTSAVTITLASPGVVSWTAHGLANGSSVNLSTSGALPTGLTAGVTYWVVSAATDTFQLSATVGGAAINTSGSQSGAHTASTGEISLPAGTFDVDARMNCGTTSLSGTGFKLRLYDKTNAAALIDGTSMWSNGTVEQMCHVVGRFTLSGTTIVRLEMIATRTSTGGPFGFNAGITSVANHYADAVFTQVS